ncbi:MAG TPA: acyltransferase family protein, partial [Edaphobacter sp.]|nr:acyltransferase family protein [Edaphobacter sp.]
RAGELAAGAWLALSIRGSEDEWRQIVRWAPWCATVSVLAIIGIAVLDGGFELAAPWMTAAGLAFLALLGASMIVLAISGVRFRHAMQVGWLRWLGTISYGLYVYHVLFLDLYQQAARAMLGPRSQAVIAIVVAVIGLPCTLLIAVLSFRYLESPLLKLKKRFGHGEEQKITRPVQHIAS